MSLDETYDRMRVFQAALARFDEALRASLRALDASHTGAQGAWQDTFAREYAAAWEPLEQGLQRWCQHEGPQYRQFVDEKLRALVRYLEDDR